MMFLFFLFELGVCIFSDFVAQTCCASNYSRFISGLCGAKLALEIEKHKLLALSLKPFENPKNTNASL